MSDRPPETDPEGHAAPDGTIPVDSLAESGSSVGPFLLRERIGSGGMGVVWKAEQTSPVRRTVALKLIKAGMDSQEVLARFEAERQALALMDHPGIAKVFDAGTTSEGRPWFAMEYVRGIPITDYCDKHRLSTEDRLHLFLQVCQGVQHAHQKAVLHRDLKPGNILVADVDEKPLPKIIDFGVAKATAQKLTEKTMYTEMGQLIGTPEYMSPEQAELTGEDVDTRTDVYSLGVILYELLVGALPFDPKNLRKAGFDGIIKMLREQDPPRPSTRLSTLGEKTTEIAAHRRTGPRRLSSQLRGDLDWIVMQCLEKDRNRRYGSPHELEQDIKRHLEHEPVAAGPPSLSYRMRKFVRRHRVGVGVTASAFVLLTAFSAIVGIQSQRIAAERDKSSQEAETAQQISEFLVGLFEVSDPSEARGRSITALEILNEGVDKIEQELAEQPLIQARLMGTMGWVYFKLGLYRESQPLLEEALRIRQDELGEEHLDVAQSMHDLGVLLERSADYEGARPLFETALTIREMGLGPEHLEVASTLNSLANLLRQTGDYEEAIKLHERALSIREKSVGPEDLPVAMSLYNLASVVRRTGDYDRARELYERALTILESELGPDHPDLAYGLNGLANLRHSTGDHEDAVPLYERALAIWEESLGPDHALVAICLSNLAGELNEIGDFEEAAALYERALAINESTLGPGHPDLGRTLVGIGWNMYEVGQFERARSCYDRALAILERNLGPDHFEVANILNNIALIRVAEGDYEGAVPLYERALKIDAENLPPDHPFLVEVLEGYSALLRTMGRAAEADELPARAAWMREKVPANGGE